MKAKKFSIIDLILIELSSIAVALFSVAICPWLQRWLTEGVWAWYLLIVCVILGIKPMITFFGQKST